jgi:putative ABC transport system permease protein
MSFRGLALLREIVREALHGISRNRFRAGLSMLGISWGIVSVVMLLAYGQGFHGALSRGFANAFGSGVVIAWPGQTSMQAGGERAGRRVRVTVDDVTRGGGTAARQAREPRVHEPPERLVRHQAGQLHGARRRARVRVDAHARCPARGGRFLNAEDVQMRRRVVFLGSEVHRKLFGQGTRWARPCGSAA